MLRLFSYLAALSVLLFLISGAGMLWLSSSTIAQSRQAMITALAKSAGQSLSSRIDQISETLEKLAQEPETVQATAAQNPELQQNVADKIKRLLPHVLSVRFLQPGVTELDDTTAPPMTYGDLNMVRETFSGDKNPKPAVQGDDPKNRHLAITRKIVHEGKTIGVLLVGFSLDLIRKNLALTQVENGFISLYQAKLLLGSTGTPPSGIGNDALKIAIPKTDWELRYGTVELPLQLDSSLMLGFLLIPLGVLLMMLLLSYRSLSKMLSEDLASTMRAFKDLMRNNYQGNYATQLNEMSGFISTLAQFKRVLDNDSPDLPGNANNKPDDSFGFTEFTEDIPEFGYTRKAPAPASKKNPASEPKSDRVFAKPSPAALNLKPGSSPAPSASAATPLKAPGPLPKAEQADDEIVIPLEMKPDAKATIFRACDIRGIVGDSLTREIASDIGRALGTEAKAKGCDRLVLGRDSRNSSPGLAEVIAEGILSTGCGIVDIGRVPTPLLYFAAQHLEQRSGVMITGGHNPVEYNGVKMLIKGETLADERIQALKKCTEKKAFTTGKPGKLEKEERYTNDYIGVVSEDVHLGRPMKIVVDCGNGVAGDIAPILLKTIGCEVIELYCEVKGNFPNHHPDPSKPENLEELSMLVKHYQADLGIAFDGDGDRLGIVDSNGKIIWPDRLLMLLAQHVLKSRPGSEIVYDVKCSRHVSGQIKKFGGRPTLWKSGHARMKAKLRETGAALAGEMSGHFYFNDRWNGFDDAFYTSARLIEILSEDTRTSAEVFADFPDSVCTPEINIMLKEGENAGIIEKLKKAAHFADAEISLIDGIRADFPDGFGLVRASNTLPCLAFRFEADSRESLAAIQKQFSRLIKSVNPDLLLPF